MTQHFRYTMQGRMRLARYPLIAGVLLLAVAFWRAEPGTIWFYVPLLIALFLLIRSALYLFAGRSELEISDTGIVRHGQGVLFSDARVTLRTRRRAGVLEVQNVLVEGPAMPTGTVPAVIFERTLERFTEAVTAVLKRVPDARVTVLAEGDAPLPAEEKETLLSPLRGTAVERALASLGRAGGLNVPPTLKN